METLISRAARVISVYMGIGGMTEREAKTETWLALIEAGIDSEDAFLAVSAAMILVRDRAEV